MFDESLYWLALYKEFLWNFTPRELTLIKENFETLENFWREEAEKIFKFAEKNKMKRNKIEDFIKRRNKIDFNGIIKLRDELSNKGIKILTCIDELYPDNLRRPRFWYVSLGRGVFIYNPRVIFVKGDRLDFSKCVSIVGTRKCSDKGAEQAYSISRELAKRGVTIVSGLAKGIDSMAHRGAIDVEGKTIAVLPWLEPIYPRENIDLAMKIEKFGCLLSEFYRREYMKWKVDWFLERNKIIAALSNKILIVETGVIGGSIRVANIARRLGREIFVCKPNVDERDKREGFNRLRKYYGAKVYRDIDDLL